MPLIKYSYFPNAFIDPDSGKKKFIFRPLLPIAMRYKNRSASFIQALLDSGADNNLFPASYGESIGINIKKGKLVEHVGIGDASLLAYEHKIHVIIGNYSFPTVIHFSFSQTIPLLGRKGFFFYFHFVKFDEKQHIIELKY